MNTISADIFATAYADSLLERFLGYARTYSESCSAAADRGNIPSTPQQKVMATFLNQEMQALGLQNVQTTKHCYTYGCLPATPGKEEAPSICLLAHIDTSEAVSGKDVQPLIHKNYRGTAIRLPHGAILDPASDEALAQAGRQGDTIITSDGSTLLGADDKAGIAEIMTAVEFLAAHPEVPHGTIEVLFSPDEETGHGMDHVPLELLASKVAYTVDGGHAGELEKECFNAVRSDVIFTGRAKHTGTARPDMVCAINMAAAFVTALPRHEQPETTDGYMGFYSAQAIRGTTEEAAVSLILRDFTREGIERRKHIVGLVADTVAQTYGGTAKVMHTQQYVNMKEELDKHPAVVDMLVQAYQAAGIPPVFVPIRGGTDGSRLTEMGIPTPNIFTGGHNFHSRTEWASLSQMIYATEVLLQLAQLWADA